MQYNVNQGLNMAFGGTVTQNSIDAALKKAQKINSSIDSEWQESQEWTAEQDKDFRVNEIAATILATITREHGQNEKTDFNEVTSISEITNLDEKITVKEFYEARLSFPNISPEYTYIKWGGLSGDHLRKSLIEEFSQGSGDLLLKYCHKQLNQREYLEAQLISALTGAVKKKNNDYSPFSCKNSVAVEELLKTDSLTVKEMKDAMLQTMRRSPQITKAPVSWVVTCTLGLLKKEEQAILMFQAVVRTLAGANGEKAKDGNEQVIGLYNKCLDVAQGEDLNVNFNIIQRAYILDAAKFNEPLLPVLQCVQQLGDLSSLMLVPDKSGNVPYKNEKLATEIKQLLSGLATYGIEKNCSYVDEKKIGDLLASAKNAFLELNTQLIQSNHTKIDNSNIDRNIKILSKKVTDAVASYSQNITGVQQQKNMGTLVKTMNGVISNMFNNSDKNKMITTYIEKLSAVPTTALQDPRVQPPTVDTLKQAS